MFSQSINFRRCEMESVTPYQATVPNIANSEMLVANIAFPLQFKHRQIVLERLFPSMLLYRSGFAGRCSLSLRVFFGRDLTRRMVTPKTNCISMGGFSTNDGRGIHDLATLDLDFRCYSGLISGQFFDITVAKSFKFCFPKVSASDVAE